jgi:hypothetical protein
MKYTIRTIQKLFFANEVGDFTFDSHVFFQASSILTSSMLNRCPGLTCYQVKGDAYSLSRVVSNHVAAGGVEAGAAASLS